MSEWISCDEKMPQVDNHVLYFMLEHGISGCGYIYDCNYTGNGKRDLYLFDGEQDIKFGEDDITHWMLFPELPV